MKIVRLIHENYPDCSLIEMKKRVQSLEKPVSAQWAYECSFRVLSLFERVFPQDLRPRNTLESMQKWINGSLSIPEARAMAFTMHALARETADPVAKAVVRSVAQAISTAHARAHALGAAMYALTAVYLSGEKEKSSDALQMEKEWQYQRFITLEHQK